MICIHVLPVYIIWCKVNEGLQDLLILCFYNIMSLLPDFLCMCWYCSVWLKVYMLVSSYHWLLLQRNPNILLHGLPWAFPGWVGTNNNPYTKPNVTATYIINWIKGAKKYYDLDMNYIGIWNERAYDITYIKVNLLDIGLA